MTFKPQKKIKATSLLGTQPTQESGLKDFFCGFITYPPLSSMYPEKMSLVNKHCQMGYVDLTVDWTTENSYSLDYILS